MSRQGCSALDTKEDKCKSMEHDVLYLSDSVIETILYNTSRIT